MKRRNSQEQKLADDARLLRDWRKWHAEQLEEARAGPHGATIAELMLVLDQLELNSAAALLDVMRRSDWSSISYDVRLTVLHQINDAIGRLRKRNGMAEIDDPLPGQPDNVYRRIKQMLFTPSPAKAGSSPSEVATAERTGRDVTAASE
jgi:hypothetical protein